ncbi:MAG TPA: hypothetical protein VGO62_05610 [Myxococcota bacterium]
MIAPVDGSVGVPLNASVIVGERFVGEAVSARLLLIDGAEIPTTTAHVPLDNGFGTLSWTRLTPNAPFVDAQTVTVEVGGAIAATFTTGISVDDEAPAPPDLRLATEADDSTYVAGSGACPPYARLVAHDSDDDVALFIARVDSDPALRDAPALAGASIDEQLLVAGPAAEAHTMHVVAADIAGNLSAPSEIGAVFPAAPHAPTSGCASAPPSSFVALLLVLGIAHLRRRSGGRAFR